MTDSHATLSQENDISIIKLDELINDNPTLIDEYGSLDFMDTVRNQIIKGVIG